MRKSELLPYGIKVDFQTQIIYQSTIWCGLQSSRITLFFLHYQNAPPWNHTTSIYTHLKPQFGTSTQHSCRERERERMMTFGLKASLLLLAILLFTDCLHVQGQNCKPSGKIRGKKPPPGECNDGNDSECCEEGKLYTTYKCSPQISSHTMGFLTLNGFDKGQDGGAPSECDNHYHSNDIPIVALSTGWYNKGSRCLNNITITANGRSVVAMVVDECDSTIGCDTDHDYQPPCDNNIVDASRAVWKALGVPDDKWGGMDITWSDA